MQHSQRQLRQRSKPTSNDWRATTVHLEGTYSCHQHTAVRLQATGPALDVHELLHTNVGTEAGLSDDVAVSTNQLQTDLQATIRQRIRITGVNDHLQYKRL